MCVCVCVCVCVHTEAKNKKTEVLKKDALLDSAGYVDM